MTPQSGHVSNFCGSVDHLIEPADVHCFQIDSSVPPTLVHSGHSGWIRLELGGAFSQTVPFAILFARSLNVVGVLLGAIRETDLPDFIAREVKHLKGDVSSQLEKQVASFVVKEGVCHQLVLKRLP